MGHFCYKIVGAWVQPGCTVDYSQGTGRTIPATSAWTINSIAVMSCDTLFSGVNTSFYPSKND